MKIKNITNKMFANDHKIIMLVNDRDASIPFSKYFVQTVKCLDRFVLIGPSSVMVAFLRFGSPTQLNAYKIDMFNEESVLYHFRIVYAHRLIPLNRKQITVFIHHTPPWSILCKNGNEFVFMGLDAMIAELILFHLNATIVMTSDLIHDDPSFGSWFDRESIFKNNFDIVFFHPEIISKTPITDFNARLVE